jgi:hypothetical protein
MNPLPETHELAEQAVDQLADMLSDEGSYTPEMTRAALRGLTTLATYLGVCLNDAQPAAVRTIADVADVALSLHITTLTLSKGIGAAVSAIDRRRLPTELVDLDITQVAALRASLARAGDGLLNAATGFGDAHQIVT